MFNYTDLSQLRVDWTQLQLTQRRQRKETLREVYLDGDRWVYKRFILNKPTLFYSQPWIKEAKALIRAQGLAVPRYIGTYAGRGHHGHREIVLQRTFIAGDKIHGALEPFVAPMAELLAALHCRGIVTRDATIDNFLLAPDEKMYFIDFGKARLHTLPSYYDVGSELARFLHGTLFYDRTLWRLFRAHYYAQRQIGAVSRSIEQFFYRICMRNRIRRRSIHV